MAVLHLTVATLILALLRICTGNWVRNVIYVYEHANVMEKVCYNFSNDIPAEGYLLSNSEFIAESMH